MEALQAAGVAAGVAQTVEDRVDFDPQLRSLNWLTEVDADQLGRWPVAESTIKFDKTPTHAGGPIDRGAPSYGEHNYQVYGDLLGLSHDEVDRLAADGVITPLSRFTFDTDSLKSYKGMHRALFRPSGLSRDPRSGRWFILSSVNKMLVVADASWRVLKVCPLDPALFIQPEGIAFDRSENLYISNEGNKTTPGTVLRFLRR